MGSSSSAGASDPRAARLQRFADQADSQATAASGTPPKRSTLAPSSASSSSSSGSSRPNPTTPSNYDKVEDPVERARLQALSKHKKRREEEKSERERLRQVLIEDKADRVRRGLVKPSGAAATGDAEMDEAAPPGQAEGTNTKPLIVLSREEHVTGALEGLNADGAKVSPDRFLFGALLFLLTAKLCPVLP